ncbi:MAG: dihydroorotate dehydrogenase-like protein, partial [Gammaproteobacteria bacterium]|nr:dihydroorotate dehydrogenase-like protein [Gammaproteobacteria bacterium]
VMHSLFEEETQSDEQLFSRFLIEQDIGYAEADTFLPTPANYVNEMDNYLEQVRKLKESLSIPVIAGLNGVSMDGWVNHGKELQQAGADALELNVYYIPANIHETGQDVEQRYIDLLTELRRHVSIPVTMKLSSQFSSIPHFVKQLEQAGANGVALFNRFYQPDINIETLHVEPKIKYSSPMESLLRVRWVAILYGQVDLSLAVTGGIHSHKDALKALLAGADVTHLCSEILTRGAHRIGEIRDDIAHWLEEHEYESIRQLKGSVSYKNAINASFYERANYINVLDSYTPAPGVWR